MGGLRKLCKLLISQLDGILARDRTLASGPTFTKSGCHPVKTTLTASTNLEDKEWIAVDNSSSTFSGNVCASWSHFTATSNMIFFSRSTNHGVTWSKAIQINPTSQNGAVQGSQVAVGPAGEVYVAYEVFLASGQGQHFIAKSTNGGVSFGAPVAMTPAFKNLSFSATYRDNSFPALAVSPVAGKAFIYDVYTDQPTASSRTAFVRSKMAASLTFTLPIRANDVSTGQRLMPAVAADSNGVVHMSWKGVSHSEILSSRALVTDVRSYLAGDKDRRLILCFANEACPSSNVRIEQSLSGRHVSLLQPKKEDFSTIIGSGDANRLHGQEPEPRPTPRARARGVREPVDSAGEVAVDSQ